MGLGEADPLGVAQPQIQMGFVPHVVAQAGSEVIRAPVVTVLLSMALGITLLSSSVQE